jgi:hypothetical protein
VKRKALTFLTVAAAALVFTSVALALRFTDESYFPPVGTVGAPYSFSFGGAGGCGPALPYQYNIISGSVPPGLSLAKSGVVSGTPAQAGTWSFWVNLSDQDPPSADWCRPATAQREFSIQINGSGGTPPPPAPPATPNLSITTASLPAADVGSSYSLTLAASGGSGTKSWTVAAGSLPSGVSLTSGGVLSGTPAEAGTATFTVRVSSGTAAAQKQFSLEVTPALQIDGAGSQTAEVAVPLALELHATGGKAPYRWQLTQGSLPTHTGFIGDQGNGSTATIKGVPADAGDFALTFTVTDVRGKTTTHTITLNVAEKLRLTTVRKPLVGHVAKLYRAIGFAEGGVGVRTWSISGGLLPSGLQLDPKTGVISGKPLRRGRYVLYVVTKDELGAARSLKISIVIRR